MRACYGGRGETLHDEYNGDISTVMRTAESLALAPWPASNFRLVIGGMQRVTADKGTTPVLEDMWFRRSPLF